MSLRLSTREMEPGPRQAPRPGLLCLLGCSPEILECCRIHGALLDSGSTFRRQRGHHIIEFSCHVSSPGFPMPASWRGDRRTGHRPPRSNGGKNASGPPLLCHRRPAESPDAVDRRQMRHATRLPASQSEVPSYSGARALQRIDGRAAQVGAELRQKPRVRQQLVLKELIQHGQFRVEIAVKENGPGHPLNRVYNPYAIKIILMTPGRHGCPV